MSTKGSRLSMVVMVVLSAVGIFGCPAIQNTITGSRQGDRRDNLTEDMTGFWEIAAVSQHGRFNSKMELTQKGRRVQGYLFTKFFGKLWLIGTINEDKFVLKADGYYGPSGGFMIKLTGHVTGDQSSGKTYFGPRWVPWNLNYVNENYDKIRRGTFTAIRKKRPSRFSN